MNGSPAVIVNKGGFLPALVKGLFGLLITVVVCGTLCGLVVMHLAHKDLLFLTDKAEGLAQAVLAALPEWQAAAPAIVKDALNDRRAPEYREQLDVQARLAEVGGRPYVVVSVKNTGADIVSLLALRVVVEDEDNVPRREIPVYAVTPFMCEDLPGPLLPDTAARKIRRCAYGAPDGAGVTVEITDLRVANRPDQSLGAPDAAGTTELPPPAEPEAGDADA